MTDDKPTTQPTSVPASQPSEEERIAGIVRAITSETSLGLANPIKRLKQEGEWIISYSFHAEKPAKPFGKDASNVRPLDKPEEYEMAMQAFRDIEKVCMVCFVEVRDGDADIRFFKGTLNGAGGRTKTTGAIKDILVADNASMNKGTFTHEILHAAAGFLHPVSDGKDRNEAGYNPDFTRDDTAMSYNNGKSFKIGLTEGDTHALWQVFGKRDPVSGTDDVIDSARLLNGSDIVYTGKPFTLDLRDAKNLKGSLMVHAGHFIKGALGEEPLEHPNLHTRFVGGTELKDVVLNDDTPVAIIAVGNRLPNHLHGGGVRDALAPVGGNDILSGGHDTDMFILGEKSGTDNVITDLEAGEKIVVNPVGDRLELKPRKNFEYDGKKSDGTMLTAKDDAGNDLMSVFVAGAGVDQVERAIQTKQPIDVIKVNEAATTQPATSQPSSGHGLPATAKPKTQGK